MKEFWNNLKFTWRYAKYQKKSFIKFLIAEILSIAVSLIVPILSANIIVMLTNNQFYQLILVAAVIFVVENIRNVINFVVDREAHVMYRETLIRLQCDLGKNLLKLNNYTIDKNGSGVFIQRLNNDTSELSDIFYRITNVLTNLISDIGIFIAILIINKYVFIFLLIEVILIYFIDDTRVKKYIEVNKEFRKASEVVSSFASEMVRGIRDIKMLNSEESFLESFEDKIYKQNKLKYKESSIRRKFYFIRGFVRDLCDLLLTILLVIFIKDGSISVATALIAHNYSGRVPSIVYFIGDILDIVKDFNLSSKRIIEIIDSDEFEKEKFGSVHLKHVNGDFEFKKVNFSYDSNELEVLRNLSFKVNANETVGFVGKSGAGKSTIFSLLCKMYDIQSGSITIDGIDIRDLDKDSIRGNITIISQNPYIFNMSIKDNLKLVKKNLTKKEMVEACKMACLDDFIESLPKKYDTIVGEGGISLSGGQRQRLAIARALVQKTEIILFDEATSALDNETQFKIQKAITNMKGEYTILIIAHRLSTIMNADRILVVDKGKIVAEGTHQELLKTNKTYQKLYDSEIMDKN